MWMNETSNRVDVFNGYSLYVMLNVYQRSESIEYSN